MSVILRDPPFMTEHVHTIHKSTKNINFIIFKTWFYSLQRRIKAPEKSKRFQHITITISCILMIIWQTSLKVKSIFFIRPPLYEIGRPLKKDDSPFYVVFMHELLPSRSPHKLFLLLYITTRFSPGNNILLFSLLFTIILIL